MKALLVQLRGDFARLARLLRLDQAFALLFPETEDEKEHRRTLRRNAAGPQQFGRSRRAEAERQERLMAQRRRTTILTIITLGILLGGFYFFHVLLNFKTSIVAKATEVPGPYPDAAIIYLTIPALAGLFYVLLDYFEAKTGINPYNNRRGIAVTILTFIVFCSISGIPGAIMKHVTKNFAAQRGYAMCSSPFDPAHAHVYALQAYTATYGCPTVPPPQ